MSTTSDKDPGKVAVEAPNAQAGVNEINNLGVSYCSDSDDSYDDEPWGEKKTPVLKSKEEETDDEHIAEETAAKISKQLEVLALRDFRLLAESNKQVADSNKEVAESNKQVASALAKQPVFDKSYQAEAVQQVTGSNSTRKLEKENKRLKHENESLKDDLIRSLRNTCGIDRQHTTSADGTDDNDKIRDMVMGAMVKKNPGVEMVDVAGLEKAKEALVEALVLPIEHPELFTGGLKPYKNILLYGPPGTGKTYLAKAVATETDSVFFSISPSVATSKWFGESERIIRAVFEMARESKDEHFVVFFDEMDALCGRRDVGSDTIPRNIVSELLLQIDGVTTEDDNLVVIGATNRPWDLDPAILQRMEKRIYVPLPNVYARVEMIQIHLSDSKTTLKENDYDKLGDLTDGASGRDIKFLVKRALMEPVRRCKEAERFHLVGSFYMPCSSNCEYCRRCKQCHKSKGDSCKSCGTKRWQMDDFPPGKLKVHDVCMQDFETALENWCTTVEKSDLDEYEKWTEKFGEDGV